MTSKSKTDIKAFFETGDKPTESQFIDLIDSYVDRSGPIGNIEAAASANSTGYARFQSGTGTIQGFASARSDMGITVYTTALSSAVAREAINSGFATTAQAVSGDNTTTIMSPKTTKNAIEAFAAGDFNLIQSQTITSTVANVNFTSGINSSHNTYALVLSGVRVLDNNSSIDILGSFDGGSNYDTTIHSSVSQGRNSNGGTVNNTATNRIYLGEKVSNAAGRRFCSNVLLFSPAASAYTDLGVHSYWVDASGYNTIIQGSGTISTVAAINAIRVFTNAGNGFTEGTIELYGYGG